jgi:aminopeptidase
VSARVDRLGAGIGVVVHVTGLADGAAIAPLEGGIAGCELERFADLALRAGVNVQPGQLLGVYAAVGLAPLARVFAERAYAVGAAAVMVHFFDSELRALEAGHGFADPPASDVAGAAVTERLIAERGAVVNLYGDVVSDPYADAPSDRVAAILSANQAHYNRVIDAGCSWTICPAPTEAWARDVYGEPDLRRLWADLQHVLRLDEDDPVAAWQARCRELSARAARLTELRFASIRFHGPGTDLRVPLHADGRWVTSLFETAWGVPFLSNLPTEEVFTTPDFRGVEGAVRATRPVRVNGVTVRGLRLRFEAGQIVGVTADAGLAAVEAELALDAGARRLGEVALVDGSSRIGQLRRVFLNTLLDENATCHVGWGEGYTEPVPSTAALPADEREARGVNPSVVHTDAMVGGPEVTVLGVAADGGETRLIRNDVWVLDG